MLTNLVIRNYVPKEGRKLFHKPLGREYITLYVILQTVSKCDLCEEKRQQTEEAVIRLILILPITLTVKLINSNPDISVIFPPNF